MENQQQCNGGKDFNPLFAYVSLLNVVSFAIGATFASLAGTGALGREDAADRLRLLALSLEGVDVTEPEVARIMAARLNSMANLIGGATTLN